MDRFRLDGKVAIVTGAGELGGIGAEFVRVLAEAGASVVAADIRDDGARQVAETFSASALTVEPVVVDVADEESVATMVRVAEAAFGGVDILINNAALVAELTRGVGIVDYPLDEWQRVIDVNLTGPLLCARAVVPSMRARGGGKIVNMSSCGAFRPVTAYSITKYALVALTALLSDQLADDHTCVNAIAPGTVATPAFLRVHPDEKTIARSFGEVTPRLPQDIAGALLLLTSPAGDWITGQTLNVDGGLVKRL
jgi:3-oxoacyl-[acyl-carrier protein] reductase